MVSLIPCQTAHPLEPSHDIGTVPDSRQVAFEVKMVDGIKSNESREQADIGFCQRVAMKVGGILEDLFHLQKAFMHKFGIELI